MHNRVNAKNQEIHLSAMLQHLLFQQFKTLRILIKKNNKILV